MMAQFELRDDAINELSHIILGDSLVELWVKDVEETCAAEDIDAQLQEILFVILWGIEDIAHENGMPGADLLILAAINRKEFRGEVKAAQMMRDDLDRVQQQFRRRPKP